MLSGSRGPLLGGAAALLLAGCASSPKPIDQLIDSAASLRSAKELGAGQIPPAALEVRRADEAMQRARDLMGKGENEKARGELMRSKADSELAIALVRRQQAQDEANKAQENLKSVQQQAQ